MTGKATRRPISRQRKASRTASTQNNEPAGTRRLPLLICKLQLIFGPDVLARMFPKEKASWKSFASATGYFTDAPFHFAWHGWTVWQPRATQPTVGYRHRCLGGLEAQKKCWDHCAFVDFISDPAKGKKGAGVMLCCSMRVAQSLNGRSRSSVSCICREWRTRPLFWNAITVMMSTRKQAGRALESPLCAAQTPLRYRRSAEADTDGRQKNDITYPESCFLFRAYALMIRQLRRTFE